MKPILRAVLSALTLALLALTPVTAPANPILNYLRDRAYDLTDILRFKVSVPENNKSLGLHVKATSLAQVGLLHHDGQAVGMDRRVMGVWDETRSLYGVSLLTWTEIWRERAEGNQFADPHSPWAAYARRAVVRPERIHWDDGRRSPMAVGMELHTAVLPGFDLGFYPLEALDFVAGIFLLDLKRDDLSRVEAFYGSLSPAMDLAPLQVQDHATSGALFDPLADVVIEELRSQTTSGDLYRRQAPAGEQVDLMSILDQAARDLPEATPEAIPGGEEAAPEVTPGPEATPEAPPTVTSDPDPAP